MDQLPIELLTQILSQLDQTSLSRCAQVNKRWNQIALQPLLWRRVRIRASPAVNPDLINRLSIWLSDSLLDLQADRLIALELAPLLRKSKNLQKFSLGEPKNEMYFPDRERRSGQNPLKILGRCCPHLHSLHLLFCGWLLTEDVVAQLVTGCPGLTELEFREYSDFSTSNQNFISQFATLIARLTSLSLESSLKFFRQINAALSQCWSLNSLTLNRISNAELRQLLNRLPRLSELSLPFCQVTNAMAESIAAPSVGCGIQNLRLDFCTLLTVDSLKGLVSACPQLRRLCIGESHVLNGATYRLLVALLPLSLEELRLVCFTRCSLKDADLAEPLPASLKRLCLRLCPHSNLDGFTGLGLLTGLGGCKELTHLTLDLCHDDRVPALLVQLPRLRSLRFIDCRHLTRQAWANLRAVENPSASLHELKVVLYPEPAGRPVKSEPSLTDEALADLCASPIARGLRRLWLSGCTQLTPAAFISIQGGCPWLNHLVIAGCGVLSEADRQAFHAAYEHPVAVSLGKEANELILDLYLTLADSEVD